MLILALALRRIDGASKVMIALMTEYEVWRTARFLNKHGQDVKECMFHEDFESIVSSNIIITTHDLVSYFSLEDENHGKFEGFLGFVDEIDRLSNAHPLSYRGGNKVIQTFGRGFFGFCADPLTKEDKGPEGLGLPETAETTQIKLGEEWKPETDYKEIRESGDAVYQRIVEESKSQKLLLVSKTKEEMAILKTNIDKACKKIKLAKKVITFDPEDVHKKKNWQLIHDLDGSDVDVVITWQVGARSINYWKQCLVIAMFIFDQEKELRQCGGRSNRNFPSDKLIQFRMVVNEETIRRQKDDQEKSQNSC